MLCNLFRVRQDGAVVGTVTRLTSQGFYCKITDVSGMHSSFVSCLSRSMHSTVLCLTWRRKQ
jgi:hypothetical protein